MFHYAECNGQWSGAGIAQAIFMVSAIFSSSIARYPFSTFLEPIILIGRYLITFSGGIAWEIMGMLCCQS
jgi:hypothetical protein